MPALRKKACPASVRNAGAQLVKTRRMAEDLANQIIVTRAAVKATIPEMVEAGAKEMQAGQALVFLMEAGRAEGLVGMAHDSLRAVLGALNFAEPTNAEITDILAREITPRGGGGGGKGGRGR